MAGILDSLFLPSTYGGGSDPTGLLALINSQAGYQPSQGFGPQPSPAPAIPQAAPLAVGGYQMPRLGAADLYNPAQVNLPPAAQPTQGMQQPQPQQAPDQGQLPPALGGNQFGGNFGAGLQNFVNTPGGLLGKILGGVTGFATGQRTDPVGMQQQNLGAQYSAFRQMLQQNGASPQEASTRALLAITNPEAAKTILTEALTNKEKYGVISEDPLQGKQYGFINERDQTINGKPISQINAGGQGQSQGLYALTDKLQSMQAAGASREQMLNEIPSAYRNDIDALLSGKSVPQNMGRAQIRGSLITLAHAVDPTFDETKIPLRVKTVTDYAPNGQSGRSIVALNTVQHHIGKLSDDLENIGDTGWTALNALRNGIATNTPLDPKQGKAIQSVQDDMKAVTDEMSAAYKAGRVSDHEIEAWNRLASSNLPVRQLKQGIVDFVGLLNGKRDQLNETHQAIVGTEAPGINRDLNEAVTKKVNDRNNGTTSAQSGAPQFQEGATATNPQTGQKITFRNGKWQ